MTFTLVRDSSSGCGDDCRAWISAKGRFDEETPRLFSNIMAGMGTRSLPLHVDSSGGSVTAALAVADEVRGRHMTVVVARTQLDACDAPVCGTAQDGYVQGRSVLGSRCHSACVYVLAAGEQRIVGEGAAVGVHQVKDSGGVDLGRPCRLDGDGISTLVGDGHGRCPMTWREMEIYVALRLHLARMGVDARVLDLALRTSSKSLRRLSRDELLSTRLATEVAEVRRRHGGPEVSPLMVPPVAAAH